MIQGSFFVVLESMELNAEQQSAVQHDKGPMLIIAGAGTGKTRVITERILELIRSEKAVAGEILALTFTEKASNEMAERVEAGMPLSYEQLHIRTFHSFSEHILREAGLEIGIDPGYRILDQIQQWFFVKKYFYEFELDYYRPVGNPNRFIYSVLSHISKLKDELVSPDAYIKYASRLEGEEGEKMLEIANFYKKYQELIIANNYLDFGDLTYFALELLQKRESVLGRYQDQFKYVMIDEFQDTNYAQFQLVLFLAKKHNNIVVVGDDDQSIYKWRGASLSNILQFEKAFPDRKNVVLIENYRSAVNILDGSYSVIQNNNPDRLEVKTGVNKKLKCNIEGDEKIEVHHFPSFVQETTFVAGKIQLLHEKGVPYNEIAILSRTNNLVHPFIDELKYYGIPYQVRNPKGLMSLDEVKDLIALARLLADLNDDVALLRLMKMEVFNISMAEILDHMNLPEKVSLLKAISPNADTLPGMASGITKLHKLLTEMIEFSKNKSIAEVIIEFIRRINYIEYLAENNKYDELKNIEEFGVQVKKFEKDNPDNTAIDFVNYLNLLEESGAKMGGGNTDDRDGVQVLTVHGSKGLEFKHVFIISTVGSRFPGANRRDPFEIPEELTNEIYPGGDIHMQEERRLFYVAMTRAKERLFITYSNQYEGNKKWKASRFVDDVLNSGFATNIDHKETSDAISKLADVKGEKKSKFELPPFDRKRLSYSQVNTFKMCPLRYSYSYMMKIPQPESAVGNFGTSIHETLKEFYRQLKAGKEIDMALMEKLFNENWVPYGYDSVQHHDAQKKLGLEMLGKYFEENSKPWVLPSFIERPFSLKVGEYLLTGRIDRIDKLEDGTYEIIDYKTGAVQQESGLKRDLQLSIYALACKEVFGIEVSKLSLYFMQDNSKISTTRSSDDIEGTKDQIIESIEEMYASKFSPTPGFHCNHCPYKLICPAV